MDHSTSDLRKDKKTSLYVNWYEVKNVITLVVWLARLSARFAS